MLQGTRVHNEHTTFETGSLTWHVQDFTNSELRFVVSRGFSSRFGVEAMLPLRASSGTIHFQDAERRPLELADGSIHHRNETLLGPSDPWLLGHAARSKGAFTFALRAGVAVPLGRTEANPFELGRRGLTHQHVQFGTGTWDPLLGLGVGRPAGRVNWSLMGLARLVVAENAHGYRAGHRFSVSLQAEHPLSAKWHALAGADALHERSETWQGRREEEGNLGRSDVLLGIGMARSLGAGSLSLSVRVPIVTRAESAQLDYPVVISIAWNRERR